MYKSRYLCALLSRFMTVPPVHKKIVWKIRADTRCEPLSFASFLPVKECFNNPCDEQLPWDDPNALHSSAQNSLLPDGYDMLLQDER